MRFFEIVAENRAFRKLWLAGLISNSGDWVLATVLPFYIYEQTRSLTATALLMLSYSLPGLLFGSVGGVWADKFDRRGVMILSDVGRALLLILLFFSSLPEQFWLICLVAFGETTFEQFFTPARNAFLPQIVPSEKLLLANTFNSFANNLPRLVGPLLGALLYNFGGFRGAVVADIFSYLGSAFLVATIAKPASAMQENLSSSSFGANWRDGAKFLGGQPILLKILLVAGLALFAESLLSVLVVPFTKEVMGSDVAVLGWLFSVRGVGGIVGAFLVGRFLSKLSAWTLFSGGLVGVGVLNGLMWLLPTVTAQTILVFLLGAPIICYVSGQQTLLQKLTPPEYQGRIFGWQATFSGLLLLLGNGLAGVAGETFGIVPTLLFSAGLYLGLGLVVAANKVKTTTVR